MGEGWGRRRDGMGWDDDVAKYRRGMRDPNARMGNGTRQIPEHAHPNTIAHSTKTQLPKHIHRGEHQTKQENATMGNRERENEQADPNHPSGPPSWTLEVQREYTASLCFRYRSPFNV